jgi:MoaA/NifB/PqqE/SkfB family radical SAM enzyme
MSQTAPARPAGPAAGYRKARLEYLRARAEENVRRNHEEYGQRKIVLTSTPQNVFVQINAVCNANCVFCSKGYDYPLFRLDDWLGKYGDQITPVLANARQAVLTGSGEFLGLPDAPRILDYFNGEFPHVEKYLATNGSYLTPKIVERICSGESRYVLQLSLHGSDQETHRAMMRYRAHERVQDNIRTLMEARGKNGNVQVLFMFILTTLNIDDLPNFVRYARVMGADKVVCGYFYIYEANQKYLSLYFKQELANKRIAEARKVADELGIAFQAPPKFGLAPEVYKKPDCCQEPWYQIMLSVEGHILPCDVYGRFPRGENLNEKTFQEIWNGPAYREIRKALAKNQGCITHCPRHNPKSVNDWHSHVIHRPKEDRLVVKESTEALRRP